MNEDLRKWFGKGEKGGVGGGGWDRYNTKGERIGKCAREPGEPKPKCLSKEKAAKMSKDQIAAAVRRKREADPVADRPGKGGTPKMVSNKIKENYSNEEERYCPLCDKREARSECSYGEKTWDKVSVKDEEYSMVRRQLDTMLKSVEKIQDKVGKGEGDLESWIQAKITKAADYIDTAADYINTNEEKDPCWKGYKQVGMKKKGSKMVPNCVPEELEERFERINTTGKTYRVFFIFRGKYDSIQFFFPTSKRPSKEEVVIQLRKIYPEANLVNYIERDREPNAPLIQVEGATSFNKFLENVQSGPLLPGEGRKVYPKDKAPKPTGAKLPLASRGKGGSPYEPYTGPEKKGPYVPAPQRPKPQMASYEPEGELVDENLIDTVKNFVGLAKDRDRKVSEKTPMGKAVTGLQKRRQETDKYLKMLKNDYQMEDWQKVNRKDKTDGLSQKAVNAYRRENPGSKLQTAVTEKNPEGKRAERRKSFCRRMSGMKSKLTSSKTARDPDSRINKALRRWNCN